MRNGQFQVHYKDRSVGTIVSEREVINLVETRIPETNPYRYYLVFSLKYYLSYRFIMKENPQDFFIREVLVNKDEMILPKFLDELKVDLPEPGINRDYFI